MRVCFVGMQSFCFVCALSAIAPLRSRRRSINQKKQMFGGRGGKALRDTNVSQNLIVLALTLNHEWTHVLSGFQKERLEQYKRYQSNLNCSRSLTRVHIKYFCKLSVDCTGTGVTRTTVTKHSVFCSFCEYECAIIRVSSKELSKGTEHRARRLTTTWIDKSYLTVVASAQSHLSIVRKQTAFNLFKCWNVKTEHHLPQVIFFRRNIAAGFEQGKRVTPNKNDPVVLTIHGHIMRVELLARITYSTLSLLFDIYLPIHFQNLV
jgi:hypothetical protein